MKRSSQMFEEPELMDRQIASAPVLRLDSRDLFKHAREVEIEHEGRIYRLRLTQLNKLILNA